ncbi:tumor necrosis factor receptor superfamily member 5 isoform X2 [Salvelinus namaycush]|uniref:Tumor necrosis factor receptor superfamily member 5 isoform X2 n=1 Tax=Salvelinus namaycush TaxID=8040 RepID=A0A8U1EYQ8_SALNM|nr:tumor necrosis factor receptor superfamily member 5 isoform X2 [Salvelinus namaycush]
MIVLLLCILSVLTVVYSCDPETQYLKNGECCSMCGPGTKMLSSHSGCFDPHCMPCQEGEYQHAFTNKNLCKLQPYCDPNKNFEHSTNRNKTSLSPCKCKTGYHCSSEECLTCVPHTKCRPGEEVKSKGSPIHDTVCKACPLNMFSSDSSAESKCKLWTVCKSEFKTEAEGTAISDTICGQLGEACKKANESCMDFNLKRGTKRATADGKAEEGNAEGPEEGREQLQPMIQFVEPPSTLYPPLPGFQIPEEVEAKDVSENGHLVVQEEGKSHHVSDTQSVFYG